jgi:hypothetical protein
MWHKNLLHPGPYQKEKVGRCTELTETFGLGKKMSSVIKDSFAFGSLAKKKCQVA